MIYNKGERVIDFNEESIKGQSFKEFSANHKHLGWSQEELKQVHALITKQEKAVEAEPPSFNEPSSVSRTDSPMPDIEN